MANVNGKFIAQCHGASPAILWDHTLTNGGSRGPYITLPWSPR